MPELDRAAIRERYADYLAHITEPAAHPRSYYLVTRDIPALLAEVDRLRAIEAAAQAVLARQREYADCSDPSATRSMADAYVEALDQLEAALAPARTP